jgi:hypothetical protein
VIKTYPHTGNVKKSRQISKDGRKMHVMLSKLEEPHKTINLGLSIRARGHAYNVGREEKIRKLWIWMLRYAGTII